MTAKIGALLAILLTLPMPALAQLKVIISGGFSSAYEKLVPEFERANGVKVTTGSGASQGKGPQTIAAQLAAGAQFDVAIMSREGLNELIAAKRIIAGTDADLASAALGVAVRSGAPKPDVSTVEAFKQAVVKARTVAVPQSTSGIYLMNDLFPRLGLAGKIEVKATPRGKGATDMVAAGEAQIAVMPVSEILHARGVDHAGEIPREIQLIQPFAAAVVAGSKEADAGNKLIAFLTSERAAAVITASGMEPLGKRR